MTIGTRAVFDLRVGTTHTVEVLVHLRLADVQWFNSAYEDNQRELFQLIGRKILPREFGDEMDRYQQEKAKQRQPPSSREKGTVVVGERNEKQKTKAGTKRKRGKKEKEKAKQDIPKPKEEKRKHDKQVFGRNLQVTYRLEEIRPSESALLLYTESNDSNNRKKSDNKATFKQLPKLSKRVSLWCFRFDPENPIAPNPEGGGFPRPELIPIASLFREPNEDLL